MGSGPVIINAETRRRKYFNADAGHQIDGFLSCKHMCCREGVERAPKAPKNSFVSAASLANSSQFSGHKGKAERVATAGKNAALSMPMDEQEAEIELADPASRQMLGVIEQRLPKAFRNLDRLHNKVTGGRTAPVAIKKQPSLDNTNGGQPQISFLSRTNASAGNSSDKPSTDYDADWMGDLPSPFALLETPRKRLGPLPEHTPTDHGNSGPDDLPSPSALILQNNTATRGDPDDDTLEVSDPSHSNGDESDLEAIMVGLSDSVIMRENLQVQAEINQSSTAEAIPRWSRPSYEPIPNLHHSPKSREKSLSASKLFFSTNSPERVVELSQKRKAGIGDQMEGVFQSAPARKKPRVNDERDQVSTSSSNVEKQADPPGPIIKAGQPAWVYEFDAAFIAEWQDIVDFI